MAKNVSTYHLKISRAAPNQLANSMDDTSYRLTNLTTPVSLLTVDAALKMDTVQKQVCLRAVAIF